MTDPIADMLTRIRNASKSLVSEVEVRHSGIKENIARILKQEGYIADCSVEGDKVKKIKIKIKYNGKQPVIEGLKRISKPGRRVYVSVDEIPRVRSGLGIAILTTSQGVMTNVEARKKNLGGELICQVW